MTCWKLRAFRRGLGPLATRACANSRLSAGQFALEALERRSLLSAEALGTLRSTLLVTVTGPTSAAITVVPGPIHAVRSDSGLSQKPTHEDHDADDVDERESVAGRASQSSSQFAFPSTAGTANVSSASRGPETVLFRFVQSDEPWTDPVDVHSAPAPVGPAPVRTEAPTGAAAILRPHAVAAIAVEFSRAPVVLPAQILASEDAVRDVVMPFAATESMLVGAMARNPDVSLATAEAVALPVIRSLGSAALFNDALTRFVGQCSSIVGSAITPDGALTGPHRRAWAITGGTVLLDLAVAAWLVRRSRQKGRQRSRRYVPRRFVLASATPYGLRR
jgi:hypothetical protein